MISRCIVIKAYGAVKTYGVHGHVEQTLRTHQLLVEKTYPTTEAHMLLLLYKFQVISLTSKAGMECASNRFADNGKILAGAVVACLTH
jgi:hypothetical protein